MADEAPEVTEDPREPCPKHPEGIHQDLAERERHAYPDGRVEYIVMSLMCRVCGATADFEKD